MLSLELRMLWFMFGLVLGFVFALVISFYFMKRIFGKLFGFRKQSPLQDACGVFRNSVGNNLSDIPTDKPKEESSSKVFLEEFSPEKIKDYAFDYFMKNVMGFDNSSNPLQNKP